MDSENMSKMKTNDMSAEAPTYFQGNGMSIRKSPIRNQGKWIMEPGRNNFVSYESP